MSKGENKIIRRRLRNAYLSTVISISLVLLLVGVAATLLVNAESVSDYFKENLQISVLMKTDVTNEQTAALQKELDTESFVKETRFISKEQGIIEMQGMLGEDFLEVFDSSPVPASIDVSLKAEYVSADSLEMVRNRISQSPLVDEIVYQLSLIEALNANLQKISVVLAVFILLLLFISFVLINNTVRLNVFARRFTIHTMKLVGATRSFIRHPFMIKAFFQGLLSAAIAIVFLLGILYFLKGEFAQLFDVFRTDLILVVLGIVVVTGVLICMISTYFVVNKLVALDKDELYY